MPVAVALASCGPRIPADSASEGQSGAITSMAEATGSEGSPTSGSATTTSDPDAQDGSSSGEIGPRVSVVVDFENVEGDPQILEGEYPANFEGYDGEMHRSVPGRISFHEPFVLGEQAPVLSARLTASAPDWEFVVDVIAERCDEIHTCSCPCE